MTTAAPERARWPRLTAAPLPPLRPLLPRGYAGFTEATAPRHLVLPASTSVSLVVKLLDSPHRPPAFVAGGHGSGWVVEGECAPSYLEVRLAPLGAYTLLGLPTEQLSGQLVDLVEVLGAAGRRLADQLREVRAWRQRFALLDQFLLGRLDRGPRPRSLGRGSGWSPPTVSADRPARRRGRVEPQAPDHQVPAAGRPRAQDRSPADPLRRGVAAPGPAPAAGPGQVAADAGYADQAHLVREFRQFTGTTPPGSSPWSRSTRAAAPL